MREVVQQAAHTYHSELGQSLLFFGLGYTNSFEYCPSDDCLPTHLIHTGFEGLTALCAMTQWF